jgi:hypothetical protein
MEYNQSVPLYAMGQDVILNDEPDAVMSVWNDMFIPIKLRDYLLEMPAVDDDGHEIPGVKLLSNTEVLTEFPSPQTPILNGYFIICILAGLPALLGLFISRIPSRKTLGHRFIGASNIILGGLWGALGMFMACSWIFGSHTVLPHNANLFLMAPWDFIYILVGLQLLWRGDWKNVSRWLQKIVEMSTWLHACGVLILTLCGVTHLISQDVSRILVWFAPLTLLVFGSAFRSVHRVAFWGSIGLPDSTNWRTKA